MKMILLGCALVATITVGISSLQVHDAITPLPGDGAYQTLKRWNPKQFFVVPKSKSSAQVCLDLIWEMDLAYYKNGKAYSRKILVTDSFVAMSNDTGYFVALLRNRTIFRRSEYMQPTEEYLKKWSSPGIHSVAPEPFIAKIVDPTQVPQSWPKNFYPIAEENCPIDQFPKTLRKGAGRGEFARDGYYVLTLQAALQINGYPTQVDGDFNETTRQAVIQFQKEHQLQPDGIVGPQTMRLLQIGPYRPKSWYQDEMFDNIRPKIEEYYAELSQ